MEGLLGRGVLTNWGGVCPAQEDDFNAWHSLEHMPERLSVPGFLRGRRAVAVDGTPEHLKYFMMYEAETVKVFTSAPYLGRLNDPTPWTQRILSSYISPCRTVCKVIASYGHGTGGWLGTVHFYAGHKLFLAPESLAEFGSKVMNLGGVTGFHCLEGSPHIGQQPTTEKKFRESRGEADVTVDTAFMIDGLDFSAIEKALAVLLNSLGGEARANAVPVIFQTQHVLTSVDMARPA